MERHQFNTDEEYQQWLLYQQQRQSQHWTTTQQSSSGGHYPSQHQYSTDPSYYAGGYDEGYYHSGLEHAQEGLPATSPAGYSLPQGHQQNPSGHSSASSEVHAYVALPSTPQSTIDTYLSIIQLPESEESSHGSQSSSRSRRAYLCKWPGCPKAAKGESFKSKDNARVHVHKHFGTDKLFQCVVGSCRKQFASEDAAKRHRDTTDWKAYTCALCHRAFARKDYRDSHQSRCRGV